MDRSSVAGAVKALYGWYCQERKVQEHEKSDLFVEKPFEYIWIVLSTKRISKPSNKPIRVEVPHPFRTESSMNNEVCLFTKDPASEYEALLKSERVDGISKVIDISTLRTTYCQYEARRLLCSSYDLFLSDQRIIPMLPRCLGKTFFERKKQPTAVDLRKKNLAKRLEGILSSTAVFLTGGASTMIRASTTALAEDSSVDNVVAVVDGVVKKVFKGVDNIQSIFVKTQDSPSFIIYGSLD